MDNFVFLDTSFGGAKQKTTGDNIALSIGYWYNMGIKGNVMKSEKY